jgi:hypothetical protein
LVATRRVGVGPGVKMLFQRSSKNDAMSAQSYAAPGSLQECRQGGQPMSTGGKVLARCIYASQFRVIQSLIREIESNYMGWNDLEHVMSLLRAGANQTRVRCLVLVRIPKRRQTRQARSG